MAARNKIETVDEYGIWRPGCFTAKGIYFGGATKRFFSQLDPHGNSCTPQRIRALMRENCGVIPYSSSDLKGFLREFTYKLRGDASAAHSYVKTELKHTSHSLILDERYFKLRTSDQCQKSKAKDALLTRLSGVAMIISASDCTPVAIYDPVHHVAALVHSGRTGTAKRIAARVIRLMEDNFNTSPADVVVSIGPSVSHSAYDFLTKTYREFVIENHYTDNDLGRFRINRGNGSYGLDIPAAIRFQLEQIGVQPEKIYRSDLTTTENTDLFCSASAAPGNNPEERVANSGSNVYMLILEDPLTDL
ncbi:MAG TPA: laccase domain-containing protein [Candidatus Paceibacterota bacterium]|nr:laccase domain-containing protein [Candidatus Paceibacterota bacterium]